MMRLSLNLKARLNRRRRPFPNGKKIKNEIFCYCTEGGGGGGGCRGGDRGRIGSSSGAVDVHDGICC